MVVGVHLANRDRTAAATEPSGDFLRRLSVAIGNRDFLDPLGGRQLLDRPAADVAGPSQYDDLHPSSSTGFKSTKRCGMRSVPCLEPGGSPPYWKRRV